MGEKVIVVLTEAEAQADVERLGVSRDTLKGDPPFVLDALRAALTALEASTDREEPK